MKRIVLLLLIICALLCSCKETPIETTNVVTTAVTTEATSLQTTEAIAETTVVTEPAQPIVQPPLTVVVDYKKEAIDAFGYGGFDFTHSITYPKIDSDAPGAVALNEKIELLYGPMVEKLKADKEGNELYRIGFNASYTGKDYCTLAIHFTEYGGWQYSEGGSTQRFFYYDGTNDRELTVEEYLASMDVDLEKAKDNALWSYDLAKAGGTADLDGENPSHGADVNLRLPDDNEILGATAENVIYEQRFTEYGNSVMLDGAFVDTDTVTLYFSGCIYTTYTFSVTLDRETLEPVRPNYQAVISLTAQDTDKIEILFENGEVIGATAPAAYASDRITVKSHKVIVSTKGEYNDAVISVNGSAPKRWSNAGSVNEKESAYSFYTDGYIPYGELESIVIYPTRDIAPPIERAYVYERDAYSLYNGGKLNVKQSVTYPRITTGTAAAEEFNSLIADVFAPIIDELEKGNDYKIYNVTYSYKLFDGCFSIVIDYAIGRQGTEGGSYRKMYYFDVTNDRALSMDEYAARIGVDIAKAKDGALWSYDLGKAGYAAGDAVYAENPHEDFVTPEKNRIYFMKHGSFDSSVALDGIGVSENEVVLYMSGHAFVSTIFTVTLERTSLLPVNLNYFCRIDTENAPEGKFEITFTPRRLETVSLPKGVKTLTITSSSITFESDVPFDTDTFKINGEKWGREFSAGYDREINGYSYYFVPDKYRASSELVSITIDER